MASQGKSQILQEMQKASNICWNSGHELSLPFFSSLFRSFQASSVQSYGASWPREDADCDNDIVHFDRLQKPITLSNH